VRQIRVWSHRQDIGDSTECDSFVFPHIRIRLPEPISVTGSTAHSLKPSFQSPQSQSSRLSSRSSALNSSRVIPPSVVATFDMFPELYVYSVGVVVRGMNNRSVSGLNPAITPVPDMTYRLPIESHCRRWSGHSSSPGRSRRPSR
jgi:hypothetical protein